MENKPYQLILTVSAEQDLGDIWAYVIKTWSVTQAQSQHFAIMALLDMLKDFPHLGSESPDLITGIHSFTVPPHIILYTLVENRIEIVRILDRRVDLPQVLKI